MGARADDGLDRANCVPPLLSDSWVLGARCGFYRKLSSQSTRNMAHVDRKRTRTHRKVPEPMNRMRFRAGSSTWWNLRAQHNNMWGPTKQKILNKLHAISWPPEIYSNIMKVGLQSEAPLNAVPRESQTCGNERGTRLKKYQWQIYELLVLQKAKNRVEWADFHVNRHASGGGGSLAHHRKNTWKPASACLGLFCLRIF